MDKMELYHFHKEKDHDIKWKENSTILVPDNFKSTTYNRFLNFSNTIALSENSTINYYQLVENFLKSGDTNREIMLDLLKIAHDISFRSNEFKRESALENYRIDNKINVPSRLHCVYLTDEKGIEGWKKIFGGNYNLTLYRVEVTGTIFKTNEQLIPDERLCYGDVYAAAYNYWHPNFKKVPDDSNEYLSQGKIKVLEKIKSI